MMNNLKLSLPPPRYCVGGVGGGGIGGGLWKKFYFNNCNEKIMEYVYKFLHKWLLLFLKPGYFFFFKKKVTRVRHKSRSRWSRVNGNLINMGDYFKNYANPTSTSNGTGECSTNCRVKSAYPLYIYIGGCKERLFWWTIDRLVLVCAHPSRLRTDGGGGVFQERSIW